MKSRPIVARMSLALGLAACLAAGRSALAQDEPKTVTDAIAGVMTAAQGGDMVKAIEMSELAVKLDPKNPQALFLLTATTQSRAAQINDEKPKYEMFHRSAEAARKLAALGVQAAPAQKTLIAQAYYNDACYHALNKDADKALKILGEAIDAGFSDAANMANDTDLASLKSRPEWSTLTEKIAGNAKKAAEARKAAEAEMATAMIAKIKDEMKDFKSFPFTFSLPDLNGKKVSLDEYKGKVTIVDVWGTWCPPCRMEIPHFVELKKKYKDKGFDIVGLNYENGDPASAKKLIEDFVSANGMNYKCLIGDEATTKMIPEFGAFPTTLFLDKTGKVRYLHVGYAPYPVLESIVKTLLAEGANP